MDTRELSENGLKLRKQMFGDDAVEQRMKAFGKFGEPLQTIINAYAYGDVWSRSALPMATKSLAMVAMMAAVDAGVRRLVHVPNKTWVMRADAQKLAATGTHILGTIGFGAPIFGVFENDNNARFRDGKPWPQSIVGADLLDGVPVGQEIGYTTVNSRTLWDAGAALGYCTDSTYDALAGLDHELKTYNMMFSMQDIVKLMGPNTAAYIQMSDQLGTLEAGKIADIVLLDGNPLEGYWNWLKTKVTIKGGVVVVDKRAAR